MSLEDGCERYNASSALMNGKIRTKIDADKDAKILLRKFRWKNFYLHLNPFNYFKEHKPFGWKDYFAKQ